MNKLLALGLLVCSLAFCGQKTKAELEAELAKTRAALAELAASETETGASSPENCEKVLHTLLTALARLSDDGRRQAAGLGQTVRETGQVVAEGNDEIRQAQNENAGVAQVAAAKAASEARSSQLTQILGFLTVMGTIGFRAWTERNHHTETAGRIDALGQQFQRRASDTPADQGKGEK